MTGCSLMEGTREVRLIPNRQLVRHPRRHSSLDKVLLEQDGKQLQICHWDWVKLHPWALAGTAADFAKLPVIPTRCSVSLTRLGVLLPLHECSWISRLNWYVLSFYLHECCKCELTLNEDVRPLLKRVDPFSGKENFVRLRFETMKCKMMHDVYAKNGHIFFIKGLCQSNCKHYKEHCFIW